MKIDASQKRELLQAVETLRSFVEFLDEKKGCISCYNWSGGTNGGCQLAGDSMPPQDVIENECESWEIFD